MYHYAGNNPVKYTDPTGMWLDNGDGTFTAQEGDTLWEKYGADWQEKSGFKGDPRNLKPGDIVGQKKMYPMMTYSNHDMERKENQLTLKKQESNINVAEKGSYNRKANIAIGIGEILLGGAFYVGSTISAAKIEVDTLGVGSYYAGLSIVEGYAAGAGFIAYGISRLSGTNKQPFKNDVINTLVPPDVDIATSIDNYAKEKR